ncbi:MAG: hypothetical protein O2819_08145 [Planctomycetota bacterium]|nr:hypothetical protein [Planctomycetota bacterium]MDA1106549.1 hypothetical protein [Planctomycetota bacterium]
MTCSVMAPLASFAALVLAAGTAAGQADVVGTAANPGPTPWNSPTPAETTRDMEVAVARAGDLATTAGIASVPVAAERLVFVSALEPRPLSRWVSQVSAARAAISRALGREERRAMDEGVIVLFVAESESQARIVREGAFPGSGGSGLGHPVGTHHTKEQERAATIVLDGSAEASRASEDLLLEVVAVALHQVESDAVVPPWMAEGLTSRVARAMKVSTPHMDAARSELVRAIRADPRHALQGFVSGSEPPAGSGMLAAELIETERPGALAKVIMLVKEGTPPADALKQGAGITLAQLGNAMARWYQTND